MTAFLEKLRRICTSCPEEIGGWSPDGLAFEVRSSRFEDLLKNYFKGTVKTFIRQLHFYGFSKSESVNGRWTFAHPKLSRDNPDAVLEITRKTRMNSVVYTPREDFEQLRSEVQQMKTILKTDVKEIKNQLKDLWKLFESFKSTTNSKNEFINEAEQEQEFSHFPDLDFNKFSFEPSRTNSTSSSTLSLSAKSEDGLRRKAVQTNTTIPKKKVKLCSSVEDDAAPNDPVLDFMLSGFSLPIRDIDLDMPPASKILRED